MANLNIAIKIAADVAGAVGPIGSLKNTLSGLRDAVNSGFSGLQNLAVLAGGAALAGVGALGAALYTSVGAAMDAQKGQAELAAVLESTHGAAGMTAEAVNELASKFQALTPFEDDAILAGENMLLTFTNIGKDVFPMATEAMLNMGQKFGSVDAAAVQLGKALNDPIAGVSALRKVGVTLTEAQEASIKAFMEQGDIASAQKVILGELETEFGGLARAAGETLSGKLAILQHTFGDIQETIGTAFLPVLSEVADMLVSGLNSDLVQGALSGLTGFITSTVIPGLETMAGTISAFVANLQEGMSPLNAFIEAIWDLAPPEVLAFLVSLRDDILPGLSAFFTENVQPILDFVTQFVGWKDVLMALGVVVASIVLPALGGMVAAAAPVIAVGAALVGAIALARNAWEGDWGGIRTAVEGAWAAIQPALEQVRTLLENFINLVLPPLHQAWQTLGQVWQTEIQPALGQLWDSLQKLFAELGLGTGKTDVWQAALGLLKLALAGVVTGVQLLTPIIRGLGDGIQFGIDIVRRFVDGLISLKRAAEQIIAPLQAVANKIQELISSALSMPDWLIPGSPTPFEVGLRGIGAAVRALPEMNFNVAGGGQGLSLPLPSGRGELALAGGGGGITIGQITINADSYEGGQEAGRGFVDYLRSSGQMVNL